MSNLLLEEDRKKIKKDYFFRLTAVIFFLSAASVFIGSVLLLPSLFLVESKKMSLVRDTGSGDIFIEEENPRNVVRNTEERLNLLAESKGYEKVGDVLTAALDEQVSGIRLSSFAYVREGAEAGSIELDGVASNRSVLVDFSRRLERNQQFSDVVLPVSNLAENQNIRFSLSMKSIQ